ncbi:MAG: type II toxin-antitoxin system death-on-curing family toxin [Flavobacteriales bacterium]
MIELRDALNIHDILIDKFGGSKGVRDQGALESALHRPFATFDNQELYPSPTEKAAAVFESILINHPFIDGNKRTAYVLMRLILLEAGLDINASQDEKYQVVIAASTGEIRFEQIKHWIQTHVTQKKGAQP